MFFLKALLLPIAESRAMKAAIEEAKSDPARAKDVAVARTIIETIPIRMERIYGTGTRMSRIVLAYLHQRGAEFDAPLQTDTAGTIRLSADPLCCYSKPWSAWCSPEPQVEWLERAAKLVWNYCEEAGLSPRLAPLLNGDRHAKQQFAIVIKFSDRKSDYFYTAIYADWVLEEVTLPQTLDDIRAGKSPKTGHIISREALRANIAFEMQLTRQTFGHAPACKTPMPPVIEQLARDGNLRQTVKPLNYLNEKFWRPRGPDDIVEAANGYLKGIPQAIAGYAHSSFPAIDGKPFCTLMILEKHHIAQELDLNKEALPENLRGAARIVWNQLIAIGLNPKLRASDVDVFYPSGNYSLPGEINREPRFHIYIDWSDMSAAEPG